MATTAYVKYALTGGAGNALDGIASSGLLDGDFAFVFVNNTLYAFIYDDDNGGTDNGLNIIAPNDIGGGNGRWVLYQIYAGTKYITQAASDTLTLDEIMGTVICNYGQASENTQTMPATINEKVSGTIIIGTAGAGAFHLKAGANFKLYIDGTATDNGDKASIATPAVGNSMSYVAFQTGASQYDLLIISGPGTTVTDGGA